jgi:hypothetical protein
MERKRVKKDFLFIRCNLIDRLAYACSLFFSSKKATKKIDPPLKGEQQAVVNCSKFLLE